MASVQLPNKSAVTTISSGDILYVVHDPGGTPSDGKATVDVLKTFFQSGSLLAASNLSDLASAATARTNLGLGTAAVEAVSAFDAAGAATAALASANGYTDTVASGKANTSHTHAASDITSGVLAEDRGGAGAASGILQANGSGTVSAITVGSGLSFSGGTLSATGGGGGSSVSPWKASVRVAATSDVDIATGLEEGQAVDDVILAAGDRVLLWQQVDGTQNGIYVCPSSGAASRADDWDAAADDLACAVVPVNAGTNYAGMAFRVIGSGPVINVGTTSVSFEVAWNSNDALSLSSRYLLASGGGVAVAWGSRTTVDSSANNSIDWDARHMFEAGSSVNISVDWGNRFLQTSAGANAVDWGNLILRNSSGVSVLNWDNTTLVDSSTETSVNWGSRQLYGPGNVVVITWDGDGTVVSSVGGTTITSAVAAGVIMKTGDNPSGQAGSVAIAPGESNDAGAALTLTGGLGTTSGGNLVIKGGYGSDHGGDVILETGEGSDQNAGDLIIRSGSAGVDRGFVIVSIATNTNELRITENKIGFFGATPTTRPTAVADASGGSVVDTQARAALNALLARLRTLGLITP